MIMEFNDTPQFGSFDIVGEDYEAPKIEKHAHPGDPVKDKQDVQRMADYFKERGQMKYYLLWTLGVNVGLRISDLLTLKVGDIIDKDGNFKELELVEKKTKNTRKTLKTRKIHLNRSCRKAFMLCYEGKQINLDDYLFKNDSSNSPRNNKPQSSQSVDQTLKKAARALGIPGNVSTHTLRKTFVYHCITSAPESRRARMLEVMQEILGHRDQRTTLRYAGITDDERIDVYGSLNLVDQEIENRAKASVIAFEQNKEIREAL